VAYRAGPIRASCPLVAMAQCYCYQVLPGLHLASLLSSLQSPRSPHERIYVLPLLTILTNKVRGSIFVQQPSAWLACYRVLHDRHMAASRPYLLPPRDIHACACWSSFAGHGHRDERAV
jgi:hypothetical protein